MNKTKTKEIKIERLSLRELKEIALEMRSKPLTKDNLDYLGVVNAEMRNILNEIIKIKFEETQIHTLSEVLHNILYKIKNIYK